MALSARRSSGVRIHDPLSSHRRFGLFVSACLSYHVERLLTVPSTAPEAATSPFTLRTRTDAEAIRKVNFVAESQRLTLSTLEEPTFVPYRLRRLPLKNFWLCAFRSEFSHSHNTNQRQ